MACKLKVAADDDDADRKSDSNDGGDGKNDADRGNGKDAHGGDGKDTDRGDGKDANGSDKKGADGSDGKDADGSDEKDADADGVDEKKDEMGTRIEALWDLIVQMEKRMEVRMSK